MNNAQSMQEVYASMTNEQLANEIAKYQRMQMRLPCDSADWIRCSKLLRPLFNEAADRQAAGNVVEMVAL